jgi:hypothetical protein
MICVAWFQGVITEHDGKGTGHEGSGEDGKNAHIRPANARHRQLANTVVNIVEAYQAKLRPDALAGMRTVINIA